MSAKNNVNPDHYKIAGRDRPGENILQERHKSKLTQTPPHLQKPVEAFEDELESDTTGNPSDGNQSKNSMK